MLCNLAVLHSKMKLLSKRRQAMQRPIKPLARLRVVWLATTPTLDDCRLHGRERLRNERIIKNTLGIIGAGNALGWRH